MTSTSRVQQLPLFILTRTCTKCGIEKPIEAFALAKRGRGGRRTDCTQCRVAAERERRLHPGRKAPRRPNRRLVTSSTKVCATCGKEKSLNDFSPHPRGIFGRVRDCKACVNAKKRAERAAKHAPKPVPRPGYKFCTNCGVEKLLEEFHLHKRGFGGRDPECKECKNTAQRLKRDTPEYREYDKLKHRENKKYWANHYIENKETYRANSRAWRKNNPFKTKEAHLRRKAHLAKAIIEPVDFTRILERDGYWCYLCEKSIDPTVKSRTTAALTFDHKVPLQPRPGEPQGSHTEDNIHPAHHACNTRKGNIPFELLTPWQRRGV